MQLTPKMSIRGGAAGPPVKGLRSGGARPSVVCEEQLRQYLEAAPVLRRRFPYRAGLMSSLPRSGQGNPFVFLDLFFFAGWSFSFLCLLQKRATSLQL